jgi:hypothetical protein
MTEPPPDVVAPEHRWIWDAACRLLEENASFTDRGDDTIVSDIREDAWHNSDVEQETLTVRRVGFNACPFLLRPLPSGGERLEWQANGFARLSAVSQAKRGAHGPWT